MTILEKLADFENQELDNWYSLNDEAKSEFEKEVERFALENLSDLQNYCRTIIPKEFTSLSIVYGVISEMSQPEIHSFLFDEIKRIVFLAKKSEMPAVNLAILSDDIYLDQIAEKNYRLYQTIIDFLVQNLDSGSDLHFNLQLLDILNWYFMYLDDEQPNNSNSWLVKFEEFAENRNIQLKMTAREVLTTMNPEYKLKSLSVVDYLKRFIQFFK